MLVFYVRILVLHFKKRQIGQNTKKYLKEMCLTVHSKTQVSNASSAF